MICGDIFKFSIGSIFEVLLDSVLHENPLRPYVWLWQDWQASAIIDASGNLLDTHVLERKLSIELIMIQLDVVTNGGLTEESHYLLKKYPEAVLIDSGNKLLDDVELPYPDEERMKLLDEAALKLASEGVAYSAGDLDRRLEHLVCALDEVRESWVMFESRLVEWVALFLPQARLEIDRNGLAKKVSSSESVSELANLMNVEAPSEGPSESEWKMVREWATGISETTSRMDKMENVVRKLSQEHLPSVTAITGPLLAARLSVAAHGRMRLARLPSGTVQVLGAEKAFFNHLKSGAPPPKHGHIFMHPWVSHSPKKIRGRIARYLAGRISIASRIDAFNGTPLTGDDILEIESRVQEIRDSVNRS